MAELKSLKVKRGQFKGQLKRFSNFLENEDVDEHEIRERLEKLKEVWDKFQNIQYAIIETRKQAVPRNEEEAQQHETIELEEDEQSAAFENSYFQLIAGAKRRLGIGGQGNNEAATAGTGTAPVIKSNIKLPTISLLTFNGQYSQWMRAI